MSCLNLTLPGWLDREPLPKRTSFSRIVVTFFHSVPSSVPTNACLHFLYSIRASEDSSESTLEKSFNAWFCEYEIGMVILISLNLVRGLPQYSKDEIYGNTKWYSLQPPFLLRSWRKIMEWRGVMCVLVDGVKFLSILTNRAVISLPRSIASSFQTVLSVVLIATSSGKNNYWHRFVWFWNYQIIQEELYLIDLKHKTCCDLTISNTRARRRLHVTRANSRLLDELNSTLHSQ